MKRPAAVSGFALFATLFLTINFSDKTTAVMLLPFSAVITAFLVLYFLVSKKDSCRKKALTVIAVMCSVTAALLMFVMTEKYIRKPVLSLQGENVLISGRVKDFPEDNGNGGKYYVIVTDEVNGKRVRTKIRMLTYSPKAINAGDSVSVEASRVYELDSAGSRADGVFLGCYARKNGILSVTENKTGFAVLPALARQKIRNYFFGSLSENEAAVLTALLTSDREGMDNRVYASFLSSGVTHLLVVSGMHLSIWSGAIYLILRKMRVNARVRLAAVYLFVLFYCALTGFSPSCVRAALMMSVVFLGELFSREADPLNSLGAAVTRSALSIRIPRAAVRSRCPYPRRTASSFFLRSQRDLLRGFSVN